MQKSLVTFYRYLQDYLKNGEYYFLLTSIKYILLKKTTSKSRFYRSSVGFFLSRKGTLDFQFANYAYEWNVKKFFLQHYKNYNVFIDIGTNIGTYSIMMANFGLRCHSFEPARENFKAFKINVILNDLEHKITPYNFGLGTANRKEEFVFETMNTGASHLATSEHFDTHIPGEKTREMVEIKTFDSVLNQLDLNRSDRILVKIDTEGMEPDVLEGAQNFINTYPNLLFIIESKLTGLDDIKKYFKDTSEYRFEYLYIDDMNVGVLKKEITPENQ